MNKVRTINLQSGAVSLFMVIFAMLLMSIVTISFLRIMTSDQEQASNNDLSQSAYDSAQAGVEDAKRALLTRAQYCNTSTPAQCEDYARSLASDVCNQAIIESGVVKTADRDSSQVQSGVKYPEVKVQQSSQENLDGNSIDAALDQAYTCVTMQLDTEDYTEPLRENESKLIPLVSTSPFRSVTVEWFTNQDVSNINGAVDLPAISGQVKPLLLQQNWPTNRPSVMRTQFMQVGDNFSLRSFDSTAGIDESNVNTVFLYPATSGDNSTELTIRDVRKGQDGAGLPAEQGSVPTLTRCEPSVASGGYACSMELLLPGPVGGGNAEISYLRLTPLYRATHVRVSLGDGALFKAVQPIVDSTGRANDLFRRVQSRIDLYDTSFPYPDAAVGVNGNFCKDFGVTDTDYIPGTCTP